jgi:hypothetical protein
MFYVCKPVPFKNNSNEIEYYFAYIMYKRANTFYGESGVGNTHFAYIIDKRTSTFSGESARGNTPQEAIENANKLISEGKVEPIEEGEYYI